MNRKYLIERKRLHIRKIDCIINILNEGIKLHTAGTAEINACGEMSDVSRSAQEAILL